MGKKLVIYYGWYSHAARGKRKKNDKLQNATIAFQWSELIKMVYADPLICPRCRGRMKIIAFIRDRIVINRILKYLGLFEELPRIHSPPSTGPPEPVIYEPFFDDLPLSEQVELARTAR